MCGITGVWRYDRPDIDAVAFDRFTDSLAHRGPDGRGVQRFPDTRMNLGHRRLAILDLSPRGRQPMASADKRYWITFNGEIFNYLELRDELQALGHRFSSDCDTEVLLAAYAQWGPACQARFNGMWAFAIWDNRDRVLFLSRDRWGVKPLLYSFDSGAFAFASELKAFAVLDGFDNRIDQEHMALVLRDLCADERSERTLLAGVRRLPGGHCLTVSADGSHKIERWWRTLDHRRQVARSFEDQAAEFRELLYDACGLRMRSDVPLATALSGGLDSSSIACIVNELGQAQRGRHLAPEWQRAFVACFTGTRLDERPYAEQVITHTGMQPVFVEMNLDEHIGHVEQIMFDNEAITDVLHLGPWCVYRAMRQNGIVVSMDGHGADELLAGYYQSILSEITSAAQDLRPLRYLDMRRTMKGLIGGSAVFPFGWRMDLSRVKASLPAWGARLRGVARDYDTVRDGETLTPLDRQLYDSFHRDPLPTILRNFDRASMAHGIEIRMPFMDWRVVTYGFSIPDASKLGGGFTKRIVREAMKGVLPEPIRLRTNKIGLTSPSAQWMAGPLRPFVLDTMTSSDFRSSGIWDGKALCQEAEDGLRNSQPINHLWLYVNAQHLTRRLGRSKPA